MKVNFFLVGAQKCATTWLYHCLNDHPEIFIGGRKREFNYLGGEKYGKEVNRWFNELFPAREYNKLLGNASVDYLFDERSAQIIHEYNPKAKIIISLRNPVERFISAYKWMVRKENQVEDLEIIEVFEKALAEINEHSIYATLLTRGLYYDQIKRYVNHFSSENIKVVYFDDITLRPDKVIKQLYSFLGVYVDYKPLSFNRKPKGSSSSKLLYGLEKLLPNNRYLSKVMNGLNETVSIFFNKSSGFQESQQLYNKLTLFYQDDIVNTHKLILKNELALIEAFNLKEKWLGDLKQ